MVYIYFYVNFLYIYITKIKIDDYCYIINVGDSRAILSSNNGSKIIPLSVDHKPSQFFEQKVKNKKFNNFDYFIW